MSSGTSVPRPRTWRSIGPRFTVSIQTEARSTLIAAGFSREMTTVMTIRPSTEAAAMISRRFFFRRATSGRGTSMDEVTGVKPGVCAG